VTSISQWNKEDSAGRRENAKFKIDLDTALKELEYELGRISVTDAQVGIAVDSRAFRRDGWPHTKAQGHPGVVLTFSRPNRGVMRIATDRYYEWVDNLIAIARTLEGLRMMDRYGTTGNGKQYEGFRALPASTSATMDVAEAAVIIRDAAQLKYPPERLLEVRELAEIGVRAAIFKSHPDQNINKPKDEVEARFHLVERARQALSAHHGGGL